ncbi:MAG: 16S rRNA (cytidine(1402)-2'-O)-methyltransferase [Acidobacteria bacterium]|nr:16S rRNA (cytidine(1402)-2'-O)-methyltransferase [Acidobacteriota bacterium]MCA1611817.1 16S rRNA (cytidine(1402)-2'-O)-methyltransferase [Acidobacteriota bacterium]
MGGEQRRGSLWIVGTPIGNLEDLSPRALATLSRADAIFCEDTRVTAKIAARFGVGAPRISCPAPRESSRALELLRRLKAGETVALVSDAGMPAVSDPGQELVAAAAAAGFPVYVVPGPSAVSAALAVSGLKAVPHAFLGFLPSRSGERRRLLEARRASPDTLVWFESPHRIAGSLEDAAAVLGPRRACVARELTKIHEEVVRGTLTEAAAAFQARGAGRGEMTVVVEGATGTPAAAGDGDIDAAILEALAAGKDKRSIARDLSSLCGRPARELYARAVALARGGE